MATGVHPVSPSRATHQFTGPGVAGSTHCPFRKADFGQGIGDPLLDAPLLDAPLLDDFNCVDQVGKPVAF